jgi:hypothetical protein
MREYGSYKLDDVLKIGYYEAHRMCMILDELRARDLEFKLIAFDYSIADADYRTKVWDWIKKAQPRKYPHQNIPDYVIEDLKRRMDEALEKNG